MRTLFIVTLALSLVAGFVWLQNREHQAVGDVSGPKLSVGVAATITNKSQNQISPGTLKSRSDAEDEAPKAATEKCVEETNFKLGELSAKPDPMFGALLASNTVDENPPANLQEVSKCALQFFVKNDSSTFQMKAGNLEVEAKKISVTGSNALLTVEASQGELLVTNKNMQATCSKFEIKLPYCGPQSGKLFVTARDQVAYFSCDGLHGDFERLTLNSGKVKAELTVENNRSLLVKLGDAQLKCKSIALELANGQILMDNDIDWEGSGIDFKTLGIK